MGICICNKLTASSVAPRGGACIPALKLLEYCGLLKLESVPLRPDFLLPSSSSPDEEEASSSPSEPAPLDLELRLVAAEEPNTPVECEWSGIVMPSLSRAASTASAPPAADAVVGIGSICTTCAEQLVRGNLDRGIHLLDPPFPLGTFLLPLRVIVEGVEHGFIDLDLSLGIRGRMT